VRDSVTESEINTTVRTGHAGRILSIIDTLLKMNGTAKHEVGLIAVGCGPGSFTGIRIGIATAKGLSMALGCPTIGVSTLDALAYGALPSMIPIMPVMDARKSEIYCCLYSAEGISQKPYMNIRPEELENIVQGQTLFIGNGIPLYEEVLSKTLGNRFIKGPQNLWNPRASLIGFIALTRSVKDHSEDVAPIYVRPSDATLTLKKRSKR